MVKIPIVELPPPEILPSYPLPLENLPFAIGFPAFLLPQAQAPLPVLRVVGRAMPWAQQLFVAIRVARYALEKVDRV